jgi:squalene synthase HpnC
VVDARLRAAYARCEQLAGGHYENFPVASRLLPERMRPHIAAIYAFARTADDFADEPGMEDEQRLRLLDEWLQLLRGERLKNGDTQRFRKSGRPLLLETLSVPVFQALHHTIATHNLPVQLFEDLLSAFRQDVTKHRYQDWNEVLDYCRRSADPVGRLVLRVAGHDDPVLDRASDAVCTALQLTNFWQDLDRDWRNGRLYVPLDDRDRAGARDEDLTARRMTPEWRVVLKSLAERTRQLFDAGRPVCDGVGGRLRWELRVTWLGGRRILDKLERARFDVFTNRPTLGAADVPALLWNAAKWRD